MHGRQCRRKPTRKANARRHSVHAYVGQNKKKNGVPKIRHECERVGDIALFDN